MKEIFFKGLAVALPLAVLGGLVYLIFHGFYSLFSDMRLKRELDQIKRESEERRKQQPAVQMRKSTVEELYKLNE